MLYKNNKKSIIVCTSEYTTSKEYGGLAVFLNKFLKSLKEDFNINLILTASNNSIKKHDGVIIHQLDVDKLYLKVLKKYATWIFYLIQSFLINRKINKLIKKDSNIKFVHFSNYQYIGLLYSNKLPVVTRLSSLETLWSQAKFFSIKRVLEKLTLSKSDLILSPSHFLISELKKKYNLNSYYLPPLIEPIRRKSKKNKKKKIILTFGSISPGKGSDTIKQIINKLLKVDKDIYYYWIGNVDKQFYNSNSHYEQILKNQTSFSDRVKIIPKVKREKLFDYISQSEIIILPSLRDNSPNACLESLSLGKIVIARKDSGFNDLIKDKFNGFLFKRDKNEQILDLVSKILNFDSTTKNKYKKNIKLKNISFSPKKVVSTYKVHLKKII